jgi:oligopeptide transport system ATP-binding protein
MATSTALIALEDLKKYFPIRKGLLQKVSSYVRAVDGVDLEIASGKSFGLVGESACGKTTLGLTLLRLIEPTGGRIWFANHEITHLPRGQLRELRPQMQVVFQNPFSSLDPRMRVKDLVSEPLRIHRRAKGKALREQVEELLDSVGLGPETQYRFPRDLSGGQRQRVAVARAIALHPRFLLLDEPTSALDVSVQAQVLNLLLELQKSLGLTYLFISHDLGVIRHVCDRVAIMYLGRIVEVADTTTIFDDPRHPYTQALLSAIPEPDLDAAAEPVLLRGEVATDEEATAGCRFVHRCFAERAAECVSAEPSLADIGGGHLVACHRYAPKVTD